ncbi:MAG: glycosyltransferase family 2 protein [Saprospiraceae bacterium]|nr:glycosyltransferase family 2 protein [Saprospiraceae bacterium]
MIDLLTDVIIPAFNEEASIGLTIGAIPRALVRHIVVCNNNSSDNTKLEAIKAGATVVDAPEAGYGNACLKGMAFLDSLDIKPEVVVFLDGDYSDYPEEISVLLNAMIEQKADLVIGSRTLGQSEVGALQPQQVFGNWLATLLIRWFFGYTFTDLGPFRAIKWSKLQALEMADKNYGWTVEMQVKAAKHKMRCSEVAVKYRKRIGISKVSGTLKGSFIAGYKILWTIFKSI